jgi:MYND finger
MECAHCSNLATHLCGDCQDAAYCGSSCQKAHWGLIHSEECGAKSGGKKFIQKMHLKEGAFTNQAKRHNMTTKQFMHHVLSHEDQYDAKTVKRANLMKTMQGFKH